jgi:hypothetical protein
LDNAVGLAQAHLNLALGGQGDASFQVRPIGALITVEAIAAMLRWLLLVDGDAS